MERENDRCSGFAVVTKYKEHEQRVAIGKICVLIKEDKLNRDLIAQHMQKLPAETLDQGFSEILELFVEFVSAYPSSKVRDRVVEVVEFYPQMLRSSHRRYFPLHHLYGLSKQNPDEGILEALLTANPCLALEYMVTGLGNVCPLHIVLMRGEVHFKALFLMLEHCPQSARCALDSGKLPIHLLLGAKPQRANSIYHTLFVAALRLLLDLHPESLTVEVTESEVHLCERQQAPAGGSNQTAVDSLPSVPPAATAGPTARGGIMLTIRDDSTESGDTGVVAPVHRQFVRCEVRWSPLSRLRESGDFSLMGLAEEFLERLARARLSRQWTGGRESSRPMRGGRRASTF